VVSDPEFCGVGPVVIVRVAAVFAFAAAGLHWIAEADELFGKVERAGFANAFFDGIAGGV